MAFELTYINVFDDVNSGNIEDIQQFYKQADLKIEGKFESPSFNDAQLLRTSLEDMGEFNEQNIVKHLTTYANLKNSVAKTIASNLESELMTVVPSKSAIKSNYGKLAFWMKTLFKDVLNEEVNSIYIKNTPTKHELYMIYIASKISNHIVIIDYSYDNRAYKLYNNITPNISGTIEHLKLVDKDNIDLDKAISMLDGDLQGVTPGSKIIIIGEDLGFKLNTALVNLEKQVTNGERPSIMLLKEGIIKPTFDESSKIAKPTATSIDQLVKQIGIHMFKGDENFKVKAVDFIKKEISLEVSLGKAINRLVTFICMYNRYRLNESILVCYGEIDKLSDTYIKFISEIKITTVVIDTLGNSCRSINSNEWVQIDTGNKVEYHKFPTIVISNTVAYTASREMDTVMYNGQTQGLYRDRQYNSCNVVTLQSTFDEISILWKQDNTVKPSFESTSLSVTVPVFYTKLSGAPSNYEQVLGKLVTKHTVVYYHTYELDRHNPTTMKIHHLVNINGTMFKEQKLMYKNGKLDIEAIMGYATFTYKHLDTALQYHILSKIDTLIKDNWIEHPNMSTEEFIDTVLNTCLNLKKQIQQEMQWYDYTKQSPKLIVICQDESILTIEQSIIITLLHLCGWDIVIAVPTCYNILGGNIKFAEIQNHIIGEPRFDTNIKELKPTVVEEKKKGFFNRLFN